MIAKSGVLLQNVGDMNIVALFSGQGAQKVGMGKDFYSSSTTAQTMMSQADDV